MVSKGRNMDLKYEFNKGKIGINVANYRYIHYTKCLFNIIKYAKNDVKNIHETIFSRYCK